MLQRLFDGFLLRFSYTLWSLTLLSPAQAGFALDSRSLEPDALCRRADCIRNLHQVLPSISPRGDAPTRPAGCRSDKDYGCSMRRTDTVAYAFPRCLGTQFQPIVSTLPSPPQRRTDAGGAAVTRARHAPRTALLTPLTAIIPSRVRSPVIG